MRVLVVGANGQIGSQVVEKLNNNESINPVAMVRKQEQADAFNAKGVATKLVDLEGYVEDIEQAMDDVDAVVFTAGSGGSTGPDKTLIIDLDGAAKTIEAAKNKGIKRFVMVSAIYANNRKDWNQDIKHYYVAKHHADRILIESGLDYTIIRPGGLTNEPGIGTINVAENLQVDSVTREDVAETIVASLQADNTINKSFDLVNGDTDIVKAVKSI